MEITVIPSPISSQKNRQFRELIFGLEVWYNLEYNAAYFGRFAWGFC